MSKVITSTKKQCRSAACAPDFSHFFAKEKETIGGISTGIAACVNTASVTLVVCSCG
jgi:hypothetical protein